MTLRSPIRDLETAKAFAQQYRLDLHDPGLVHELDSINLDRPRPTDERHLDSILERLRRYEDFHHDYPFVVAPANTFSGELCLAYQVANRSPVRTPLLDLTRFMGIYGAIGVGKSTFTFLLLEQLRQHGIKLFILDPKDDSFHIATRDPDFLVISPNAKLNLLQQPSFLSQNEFISLLTTIWGDSWYAGENQKQVFDAGLTQAFTDHSTPCLADVKRIIDKMQSPKLTYSRRDAITGFSNRTTRFGRVFPGLFHTRDGISWDELFQHPLYMNALSNDESTTFIFTFLVNLLFLHNRRNGIRDRLDWVLVNDEGNQFWNAKQNNISGVPTLVTLLSKTREFGIGLLYTSVDQASQHPILKSNTNTTIAMSVTTGREAREVVENQQLNPEQAEYFRTRLERGQCIINLAKDWLEPIHCSFPYRKQEKQITPQQRREAEERINQYAPEPQEPLPKDATPPEPSQESPKTPTRKKPKKPASQPPDETPDEPRHTPIKLTIVEEAVLRTSATRIQPATKVYEAAGVSKQAGNNARTKLERLMLATASSILVRPGRGGNAVVLEPTAEGYALIGRQRPTRSRGGDGAQHRWLIQELSEAIPGASVEFSLAGKSIDIFCRFDPEKHQPVLFHIEANLSANTLIAIEVEASNPAKTAANNVTKNAAVGIALTIVAVLPRDLAKTRSALSRQLPQELAESFVVVDVFSLLGGLR